MGLHARYPKIMQQDFLTMEVTENWNAISLSLVVNFVPSPVDRGGLYISVFSLPSLISRAGKMLSMAYRYLISGGYLFLAVRFLV